MKSPMKTIVEKYGLAGVKNVEKALLEAFDWGMYEAMAEIVHTQVACILGVQNTTTSERLKGMNDIEAVKEPKEDGPAN